MPQPTSPRLPVSVIIPTYNRSALVRQAIDSVLGQSRVPEEVLVVDDGSTDDTSAVLNAYGPPVRVVSQANSGRSAARNRGLREARGALILFLDSDDLLDPRCVERCAELLEQDPQLGVVYSDATVIDGAGRFVARYSQVLRGRRPSGMILGELARRCFITVSSMVRRTALADDRFEVGMEHCEDYDLWRRLSARARFQYLDEPLLHYRFHEGMTNARERHSILESEVEVQRRFMAMSAFAALSARERARAYCAHGIKHAMLDRPGEARRYFFRAVRTSPGFLGGLPLAALSLLGVRPLQAAVVLRRRLAGNRLGTSGETRGQSSVLSAADGKPDETKSNPDTTPLLSALR